MSIDSTFKNEKGNKSMQTKTVLQRVLVMPNETKMLLFFQTIIELDVL